MAEQSRVHYEQYIKLISLHMKTMIQMTMVQLKIDKMKHYIDIILTTQTLQTQQG